MKKVAVFCDFDGTIAVDDVGSVLLSRFSTGDTEPIIEDWKRGDISSRECLEREASLARASKEELDRAICHCKLDPYFKDFVDFTKRRDMEVVIVSDGLDYYIERMLVEGGLAQLDFYANQLDVVERRFQVTFPHYDLRDCRDCGNCKTSHLERYKRDGCYTVYVGNGLSDRCPSQYADLVFAKGELLDFCRENQVDAIEFKNFRDVEREMVRRFVMTESLHDGEEISGL